MTTKHTTDTRMQIRKWMEGIPYEISFWKNTYSHKDSRTWILNQSMLHHDIQLHNFDVSSFLSQKQKDLVGARPKVLDVGCDFLTSPATCCTATPCTSIL